MFGRKQHAAHVAFLERIKAQLDEALAPRERPDMHHEMTAACLAKKTSLTVTFTNEEPRT